MARDIYHEHVKTALINDGWTITHDPLVLLSREEGGLQADLGAQKIFLADRGTQRIAVEVKSFVHPSIIHEFNDATGQYISYEEALIMTGSDRILFLALPEEIYNKLIEKAVVRRVVHRLKINFILFDPIEKTITSWIKP